MEIAHNFGFAVQAPVGIHEEEAGEEVGGGERWSSSLQRDGGGTGWRRMGVI